MNSKTILCYGDSNTYGYDPRGPFGGRYEADSRWCDLLAKQLDYRVANYGVNGRTIPNDERSFQNLQQAIQQENPEFLLILLGTNDILNRKGSPEIIAERMGSLVKQLHQDFPEVSILLLSPPQIELQEFRISIEALSILYRQIAEQEDIRFLDSFRWNVPLALDGVHFSVAGHRAFAKHLSRSLKKLL